jgi:hypothetical protein
MAPGCLSRAAHAGSYGRSQAPGGSIFPYITLPPLATTSSSPVTRLRAARGMAVEGRRPPCKPGRLSANSEPDAGRLCVHVHSRNQSSGRNGPSVEIGSPLYERAARKAPAIRRPSIASSSARDRMLASSPPDGTLEPAAHPGDDGRPTRLADAFAALDGRQPKVIGAVWLMRRSRFMRVAPCRDFL